MMSEKYIVCVDDKLKTTVSKMLHAGVSVKEMEVSEEGAKAILREVETGIALFDSKDEAVGFIETLSDQRRSSAVIAGFMGQYYPIFLVECAEFPGTELVNKSDRVGTPMHVAMTQGPLSDDLEIKGIFSPDEHWISYRLKEQDAQEGVSSWVRRTLGL
ncbi:MAG: hypothetical protein K0U29_00850 [Gammaproteobacteria bacterium]|nr:hypothetical protein [Gammaproteobacteria bacterium]MCH9743454.1 hypothetical protein [Gammaproteobacteria bacterium]